MYVCIYYSTIHGSTNECSEKAETVSQHTTVSTSVTDRHTDKFFSPSHLFALLSFRLIFFQWLNFFNKSKDLWITITNDYQQEWMTMLYFMTTSIDCSSKRGI